ncbi:heavy metal translocating P-type ATPase [Bifidobacterium longum subsp. infantis]|mgnify:CR=1 FL=1|uniref:Heavy metal translocating P-type ATPase n=1 Tax=Bifidobacterium longum subsp. infantis TaxID=1682 RepID=A0A7D5CDD7_BIFLI|nr:MULTISPECIES: heavy metal translocating P-type ATPase [Bifidobacterium]KAB1945355.1 heavy metal translocating P-type ATPase [Bifidobacterium longum subsp. infantis]KEY26990.1 ATPase [Bifidobacterium longum subsp. infantis EK3]MED7619514.1 heavy metal translocating P-type ATPase [Bifidobacterium longum subsp. infantis]NQX50181.1 heavy metal translocating P-type ATPase [Bifidobacterium longum subsp. infantis]QKY14337.1 heavy metal translocating P-type ATPase [Bifidobacterium longum subsp. inf
MSKLIRFFTKILDICKLVPMLPVVVIAAIPLALLGDWRPWGNAMAIPVLGNPGFGQWLVIALVLIIVIDTVRGMIDDLRHGQVGVDVLAVVAILSTVAVAEYWASWAVTLMITSGEAIEEYAQAKAERSLTALMAAAPQTAHVVNLPGVGRGSAADKGDSSDGFRRVGSASAAAAAHRFDTVPVEQVQLGDVLMVLPGETVPVDGELLSGTATLDLSNINGEPVPREVFAGARVMSGAVNGSTALTMRATQVAADSQYQRILELVASAQESRPAVVKTADRLAVPFTVLSLVIAGVAWAVSGVPTRFAQVLVLATPCPLLIAAPVAYIAGTGRLAAAGVLIKAQDVLENLGRVTQVFFDKTGTLTVKQPQVVRVEMLPGAAAQLDGDHVLMMAGVVESYSVHILSKGIAKAGTEAMARLRRQSENDGRPYPESDAVWFGVGREHPVVKGINEEAGKGVSGEVNGHVVRVGRLSFAAAGKDGFLTAGNADPTGPRHDLRPGTEAAGGTEEDILTRFGLLQPDEMASYVSIDGQLIARIVLRDVPRANARTALAKLHALGVARLAMLTGDKRASADIIANEVGIDEVHAELFPEDKVAAVKSAAEDGNAVTMMVGDGVNDAPVLAVADIGVAMTDGTSTAASESAQVVIMTDDIAAVPRAIAIARRTKRVMLQAVIVGLALAVIGMIVAAFDLIPVVVGAFLQEAIDVVSILWALTALIDRD